MSFTVNRRTFLGAAGGMVLAGVAARPLAHAESAGWPKMPSGRGTIPRQTRGE